MVRHRPDQAPRRATPPTWRGILATTLLALAAPAAMFAISYPALTAALLTGAVVPSLARRVEAVLRSDDRSFQRLVDDVTR